ncbi:MFS transporter [Paraliomyxa miuraensis]|uniref:MFS transporter n=1 Tax=Paraliomyxa miuraensis TaxID=376150 RepID=UPI00224E0B4D|nr:MFS transporter [Paraliomyxa miuraensis]MCX4241647.1 MFS transporter [Paraliomyxa miuraensis]
MSLTTPRKLGLLTALYLSQGLPFGFFTQALPAVMRQQGVSLAVIGSSTLLALPWALKALWAPMVDRHGSRRAWIVPLQLTSVVVLLSLALADPSHSLSWLMLGVLLTNLVAATQDIATDGLAVDLLARHERGLGNGVQVAGYRVGMIVGGGALLVAFEHWGWAWTFTCAAGILLLATIPVWRFCEPPRPRPTTSEPSVLDSLRRFAADPARRRWLAVLVVYKAGDYLGTSMLRPFYVDRGLGLADLGLLLGTVGFCAGLCGALLGGALVERLGRRRALLGFGTLQALSVASYALSVDPSAGPMQLYGPVVFEHLASGLATAALFTLMMDRCRPEHAATDYTLQASLVVLASLGSAALGGFTAHWLGYGPNFVLGGVVSLLAVGLAWSPGLLREPAVT